MPHNLKQKKNLLDFGLRRLKEKPFGKPQSSANSE